MSSANYNYRIFQKFAQQVNVENLLFFFKWYYPLHLHKKIELGILLLR